MSEVLQTYLKACKMVIHEVNKKIKGKSNIVELVMMTILAGGHVLLDDIPGVGKTTMALAFSDALKLDYNRIQFTPDVMPSDITGYTMYNKGTDTFSYVKGAVVCNLFLADEINRTSSKTQSALLQVMEEGMLTVDSKTYTLPNPFITIATQNPIGHAGTQMMPESQLDRFMVCLSIGYPDKSDEISMLKNIYVSENDKVRSILTADNITVIKEFIQGIYLDDKILDYIVRLVRATRENPLVKLGVSPRGSVVIAKLAKARAFYCGRDFVLPDDIQFVFEPCVNHRIIPKTIASNNKDHVKEIIKEVLKTVSVPNI